MGSISRMERCARLGQALGPLVEKHGGFQPGDRLTVRRAGAGADTNSPLGFFVSALHEPSGEVFELTFAENIFDPDFTDREDLVHALAVNLPGASAEEIEAAVKAARLYPADQLGAGPGIPCDELLEPPAARRDEGPPESGATGTVEMAAAMVQKVRDAVAETGVFVTSHMDELIGSLEQDVLEYLHDAAEGAGE